MSRTWSKYEGPTYDGTPESSPDMFPMFFKNVMDYISNPFPYEDHRLGQNKSWDVSAMGLMSFLDVIPTCGPHDWDQWQMDQLILNTNAKFPNRITPAMNASLLAIEVDLAEHFGIWGAIQRTLFNSLNSAVENKSVFNSIDAHSDYFCFSRAMKIFRDRFDLFLNSGQILTLLEDRFKDRLRNSFDPQNLDIKSFDKFLDCVSDIKRCARHTPMDIALNDRFISDTVLNKLKASTQVSLSTLAFALSTDPQRHDTTYLFNRIRAELPSQNLSASAPAAS